MSQTIMHQRDIVYQFLTIIILCMPHHTIPLITITSSPATGCASHEFSRCWPS